MNNGTALQAGDGTTLQKLPKPIRELLLTTLALAPEQRESASVELRGQRFGEAVRSHWGIESMHGVLDVTFREDQSRTRERVLANNVSGLRHFAVTLLKRHPVKHSVRGKMIRCLMSTPLLDEVLTLQAISTRWPCP